MLLTFLSSTLLLVLAYATTYSTTDGASYKATRKFPYDASLDSTFSPTIIETNATNGPTLTSTD